MFVVVQQVLNAIYGTGSNNMGKLATHQSIEFFRKFTQIPDFSKKELHRVHQGENHVFVTDTDGKLYGWGDNDCNLLGLNMNLPEVNQPKVIPFFSKMKIKYADGAQNHSVVLTQDGKVYTMGSNANFQLGRDAPSCGEPALIDTSNFEKDEKVVSVHTQGLVTFALSNLNNVFVWGNCMHGLCGPNQVQQHLTIPTKMQIQQKVKKIHVGYFNFFYETLDGEVYGIGDNVDGQLCTASSTPKSVPVLIPGLKNVTDIQATNAHTVFLMDGKAYGCGSADKGEFGYSEVKKYETLTLFAENVGNITDVATTEHGTYLLTSHGLFSSGAEQVGELGFNSPVKVTQKVFKAVMLDNIAQLDTIVAHANYAFLYATQKQQPGMDGGVLAGIIIGVIVGLIAVGFFTWYILTKCKKPRSKYAGIEEGNKLVFNDDQW